MLKLIGNKFDVFLMALSKTHPLLFLFLYLLLIPIFGCVYISPLVPQGSFYAPYARYEPSAILDKEKAESMLSKVVIQSLKKVKEKYGIVPVSKLLTLEDFHRKYVFTIDPADISVSDLSFQENSSIIKFVVHFLMHEEALWMKYGKISFEAKMPYMRYYTFDVTLNTTPDTCSSTKAGESLIQSLSLHRQDWNSYVQSIVLDINPRTSNDEEIYNFRITGTMVNTQSSDESFDSFDRVKTILPEPLPDVVFKTIFSIYDPCAFQDDGQNFTDEHQFATAIGVLVNSSSTTKNLMIYLSETEKDQLLHYISGISGNPISLSGQFSRMLYFSSVIITTLGLGDIVPLTWPVRTLVAVEAISGIICAGLFLNALAYRASHP